MRSQLLVRRLRTLSKASALVTLAVTTAACSNDASRLDSFITASTKSTANNGGPIHISKRVPQPFPGDVSNQVQSTGVQVASRVVAPSAPLAPAVARTPLPVVSKKVEPYSQVVKPVTVAAAQSKIPKLPQTKLPGNTSGALVLAPRVAKTQVLKMASTDRVTTGSVAPKAVTATEQPLGWKNSKGANVTVKSGETLYNLSRRYGVPVSAIMKANNIADANAVAAGSRILIPTYNYANSVPVSAPDSDPVTKASRASRGFQGQVRGRVAVPKPRVSVAQPAKVEQPATKTAYKVPVVRPQGEGTYTVASGDTLYAIARRHNVTVNALRDANNMSGDTVRLGQKLRIPTYGNRGNITQSKSVDKSVTGSISSSEATKKPSYKVPAPSITKQAQGATTTVAKTSASAFRWPVRGRLIAKFGERTPTGTNDGVDISVPVGTSIKASENGTVIYSGSELEDFGKLVLISHDDGWVSAYAHASSVMVRRGDKVSRGQVIAKSGKTGNATVPKLHFELRKNSNPVNPIKHLAN